MNFTLRVATHPILSFESLMEDGELISDLKINLDTGVLIWPDKNTRWSNFYRRGIEALGDLIEGKIYKGACPLPKFLDIRRRPALRIIK